MDLELAWAVGFFDGEGSVGLTHGTSPRLTVTNTDRELLHRFAAAVGGVGTITSAPKRVGPEGQHRKPVYSWYSAGRTAVEVIRLLRPIAGSRNRARFDRVTAAHGEARAGTCGFCGAAYTRGRANGLYCSKLCGDRARRAARVTTGSCEVCGAAFPRVYAETRCCSKKCAAFLPSRLQQFTRVMLGTPRPVESGTTEAL